MSQIKINKAAKIVKFLPMAEAEIMESIPQSLIERLTSAELAEVKKTLNYHWHKAAKHTRREIVADGCVWSDKDSQLLELQQPVQASPVTGTWNPGPKGFKPTNWGRL